MREKQGITLITLVITIIILLILLAIALQLVFGEQGIILKANKSSRENSRAELFDIATIEFSSMSLEDTLKDTDTLSFDSFYNSNAFLSRYKIISENIIDKRNNLEIISKQEFEDEFRLRFKNSGNETDKPVVNSITTEDTKISGLGKENANIIVQIGGNNYTGKVESNKKWEISIPKQKEGTEVTVSQKIGNKIESVKVTVTVLKPKLGQLVIEKVTNISKNIIGTGEEGAKVVATISGNSYESIVRHDNTFNITIPMQEEGVTIGIYQEKEGKLNSDVQSLIVEKAKIEGEDINDTILKVKVTNGTIEERKILIRTTASYVVNPIETSPILTESFTEEITEENTNIFDWGDGTKKQAYIIDVNDPKLSHIYTQGEYILRIKKVNGLIILPGESINYEIINFGRNLTTNSNGDIIVSHNTANNRRIEYLGASKISAKLRTECGEVKLSEGRFSTIPENLYEDVLPNLIEKSNTFANNSNLISIPENLYKGKNLTGLGGVFSNCTKLKKIPSELFKDMTNLTYINGIFAGCTNIKNIPENLFKYNTNLEQISSLFAGCTNIESIPENLFRYNIKLQKIDEEVDLYFNVEKPKSGTFYNCIKISIVPENLFKYNTELEEINSIFAGCTGITSVSQDLFRYNTKLQRLTGTFAYTNIINIPDNLFKFNQQLYLTALAFMGTKITSIPENLFRYNNNLATFSFMFAECKNLNNIPERLIKNSRSNRLTYARGLFLNCTRITYIPDTMFNISGVSIVADKAFKGCTNASNYNSISNRFK